jgi:hypothetical protein
MPAARDDRSAQLPAIDAHATSPAPGANTATATTSTGTHNDDLSLLDEVIDLRGAGLVYRQRHSFDFIRHHDDADGNYCSTAQDAP